MNLLIDAQTVLEKNDYIVRVSDSPNTGLIFEDDSIVGMVTVHESIKSLLVNWEKMQDSFLRNYRSQMEKELDKAWNSYMVFLSAQTVDVEWKDKIASIEEDLRGARKIVATGLVSRVDIEKALLPILPIQKSINITKEDYLERLQNRIEIAELFSLNKAEDIFMVMENKK